MHRGGVYHGNTDCSVSGIGDDGGINRMCRGNVDCGGSGIGNNGSMHRSGTCHGGTDCGIVVQVMMVACIAVVHIVVVQIVA